MKINYFEFSLLFIDSRKVELLVNEWFRFLGIGLFL